MYNQSLALEILRQIDGALRTIGDRASRIAGPEDFTATPEGEERLDGLCMRFMAVGEALKKLDKISNGELLSTHP